MSNEAVPGSERVQQSRSERETELVGKSVDQLRDRLLDAQELIFRQEAKWRLDYRRRLEQAARIRDLLVVVAESSKNACDALRLLSKSSECLHESLEISRMGVEKIVQKESGNDGKA